MSIKKILESRVGEIPNEYINAIDGLDEIMANILPMLTKDQLEKMVNRLSDKIMELKNKQTV